MFEKSLQDLVRGIRNCKKDVNQYIAQCMAEIKQEIKSREMPLKAQALQKLTYLHMLGYDCSWAAFNVVEVMTQDRFAYKRIAYLTASQTFTQSTDVVLLCTQLLKREFQAKNQYEIGLAINCLSNIANPDLSRDLLNDVATMLTSSRPYIRKKAVLVLYKMFIYYPQGLRLCFDALKKRLTDENVSVVSCAVNVICELASKNPRNYVALAPDLFNLLTTSTNNWMLIKVVKLLGALVSEEPRLARKLLAPLAEIIQSTPAKSLMYECVHTVTVALPYTKKEDGSEAKNVPAVVRLCTDKLRELIKDPDQNLKYLGLVGLVNLMQSHPKVVAEHRDLIQACLLDDDITIRLRALELLTGMVTKRNLPEIVSKLLELVETAEGHYRDELIEKIVFMCSRDKFEFLQDFAWYISVLVKLAYIQGTGHGATVAAQLLDVAVRVNTVREFAVQQMVPFLCDATVAGPSDGLTDVRYAAAFIVGEYADALEPNAVHTVLHSLVQPATASLKPHLQGAYVQCALKVLAQAAKTAAETGGSSGDIHDLAKQLCEQLRLFATSSHVEVQERATGVQRLLVALGVDFTFDTAEVASPAPAAQDRLLLVFDDAPAASSSPVVRHFDLANFANELTQIVAEPLKAVNAKAQKKVPVPDGLDLDAWIIEPERDTGDVDAAFSRVSFGEIFDEETPSGAKSAAAAGSGGRSAFAGDDDDDFFRELAAKSSPGGGAAATAPTSTSSTERSSSSRRPNNDPFMLGSYNRSDSEDVDVPIQHLTPDELHDGRSGKAVGGAAVLATPSSSLQYAVDMDDDMPTGAASSDEEEAGVRKVTEDLSSIDLTTPLRPDEVMPTQSHRVVPSRTPSKEKSSKKSSKKTSKHSSKHDDVDLLDVGAESEKPKKDKKHKKEKSSSKDDEPVSAAPVTSPSGPVLVDVPDVAPAQAAKPVVFVEDKAVRVSVVPRVLKVAGPAAANTPGAVGAVVALNVITEPRSSRKALSRVELVVQRCGGRIMPTGVQAGSTPQSIRIASNVPVKADGVQQTTTLQVSVPAESFLAGIPFQVQVVYVISGESTPVTLDATVVVPGCLLLLPMAISGEQYQAFLRSPPSPLFHAEGVVAVPEGKKPKKLFATIIGLLPCTVVQSSESMVITYSRSILGHQVTALLKNADGRISVQIKSTHEAYCATLLQSVLDSVHAE